MEFFFGLTDEACHLKCATCLSYENCTSCTDLNAKAPDC